MRDRRRVNRVPLAATVLAAMLIVTMALGGCSASRGNELQEEASKLAREGRYEEAISTLERALAIYADDPVAKDVAKQIVLYKGLLESERKEKRRRASEDLIALGRGLNRHLTSAGRYPSTLGELGTKDALPTVDPWGRPYRYQTMPGGKRYRLGCLGGDGKPGGEGDDQDLLVDTGEFSKELAWEDQ